MICFYGFSAVGLICLSLGTAFSLSAVEEKKKLNPLLVLWKHFIYTGCEWLLASTRMALHQSSRAETYPIAVFSQCCVREA